MKDNMRILAKDQYISNNTRITNLNNNDLIIGTTGCGKTRGYVIPNILQMNESMIISDSKGRLRKDLSKILENNGYKIININIMDMKNSDGYNPLDYIRWEDGKYNIQDLKTISAAMVKVTSTREPFWELAARMYLESFIGYVLECLPENEHNLSYAIKLFKLMNTDIFERLYSELEELDEDSFAFEQYIMYRDNKKAEKMQESIRGILAEKLACFSFDNVEKMFNNPKKIDFKALGKEKTAVFVNISDTDRSMDAIAEIFFTQALQVLCNSADNDYEDGRLEIPVRFILDDFANNFSIPDFDKTSSMIRSREISVSIILQSITQLNSIYGPSRATTIINNCDNLIYLGGQDVTTADYISIKANKPKDAILNMPLTNSWLFRRGEQPKEVEIFDLTTHENYELI